MDAETRTKFALSPLIRITLSLLYVALTIPLPFLAVRTAAEISPTALWVAIALGFVALQGVLSERVIADDRGIAVTYPTWVPRWWRKGWEIAWSDIVSLKWRSTGQGGLVYYFLDREGRGYLLPMRIAGFNRLLTIVQQRCTTIDTTDVYPLAQPWMYGILLLLTIALLGIDLWTIVVAIGVN
jgi:hypothetical protein